RGDPGPESPGLRREDRRPTLPKVPALRQKADLDGQRGNEPRARPLARAPLPPDENPEVPRSREADRRGVPGEGGGGLPARSARGEGVLPGPEASLGKPPPDPRPL